jgi:hypothetical protein
MRGLVMVVCVIAGMSMGIRQGQTETVPAKPGAAPPTPPTCTDGIPIRVFAQIIGIVHYNSQLIVTISAGSRAGVTRDWTAHLLRRGSDDPLPGGEIQIVRVEKTLSIGKVRLAEDEILDNQRVKLTSH